MKTYYIPKNLVECYKWLDNNVPDCDEFISSKENDAVILSHQTIGKWIRNNWGLWSENSNLYFWFLTIKIKHPDDMSCIILRSYWRDKNSLPIKLDEQIKNI